MTTWCFWGAGAGDRMRLRGTGEWLNGSAEEEAWDPGCGKASFARQEAPG